MKLKYGFPKKYICLILALCLVLSAGCRTAGEKNETATEKEAAVTADKESDNDSGKDLQSEIETDREGSTEDSSGEYESLLKKAGDYEAGGSPEQALASYDLAIRLDPGKPDAYIGKSRVYIAQEQYQEALSVMEKLLDEHPTLPEGWALKCGLDARMGDVQAFEEDIVFAEVCEADVDLYAAEIGVMYSSVSEYEKAVAYFEKADIDAMTDEEKRSFRSALVETGDKERADALGLFPENVRDPELDARFEQGNLVLKEIQNSDLPLNTETLVLTDEYKNFCLETYGEEPNPDQLFEDAAEESEEGQTNILSLSPTGEGGLAGFGYTLLPFYDGHYYICYPSATRGAEDLNGSMDSFMKWTLSSVPEHVMFSSEVVYSPNGRYAVIQSPESIILGKTSIPVLIDLTSGEMILLQDCLKPGSSRMAQLFVTGDFSADGLYFYYIMYGNFEDRRERLYRYNIAEDFSEMCASFGEYASYSDLVELGDGSWLAMCETRGEKGSDRSSGYLRFSEKKSEWDSSWTGNLLHQDIYVPSRLLYSSNSGYAVVYGSSPYYDNPSGGYPGLSQAAFQVLRPEDQFDGKDIYYCIDDRTEKIVSFTAEEFQEMLYNAAVAETDDPYLVLPTSPELSRDGNYLLLHAAEQGNAESQCLYLVRLEDMELVKVQVQGNDAGTLLSQCIGLSSRSQHFDWKTDRIIVHGNRHFSVYTFD